MNELKRHTELYHGMWPCTDVVAPIAPIFPLIPIGAKSPSELWDEVRRYRNKFKHKELSSSLLLPNHPDIGTLQSLVYSAEENMYTPVTKCLGNCSVIPLSIGNTGCKNRCACLTLTPKPTF